MWARSVLSMLAVAVLVMPVVAGDDDEDDEDESRERGEDNPEGSRSGRDGARQGGDDDRGDDEDDDDGRDDGDGRGDGDRGDDRGEDDERDEDDDDDRGRGAGAGRRGEGQDDGRGRGRIAVKGGGRGSDDGEGGAAWDAPRATPLQAAVRGAEGATLALDFPARTDDRIVVVQVPDGYRATAGGCTQQGGLLHCAVPADASLTVRVDAPAGPVSGVVAHSFPATLAAP